MAKGDKSVLAMSVNDIKADKSGNVALTAANVGADTAGAAQVVQGNLQAHIIDAVKHWTQAERDALAAALDGKAENTYGVLSAPDLLAWASMQRSGGSFTIDPSVTTAGLPKGGVWYAGQLEISNPGYGMRMTMTETYTRMSYVNATSDGIWQGWSRNATDADLANKVNRSGDSMGGNLNFGAHQLHFNVGGENNFYFRKDPYGLNICDHDGHVLITFGYGGIPTVYGNVPIATATKPAVYDLPLAAGWGAVSQWSACEYRKNQFNEVSVNFTLRSTVSPTSGMTLATLPEGYRPEKSQHVLCSIIFADYSQGVGHVDFGGDGAIKLYLDNCVGSQTVLVLYCSSVNFQAA